MNESSIVLSEEEDSLKRFLLGVRGTGEYAGSFEISFSLGLFPEA